MNNLYHTLLKIKFSQLSELSFISSVFIITLALIIKLIQFPYSFNFEIEIHNQYKLIPILSIINLLISIKFIKKGVINIREGLYLGIFILLTSINIFSERYAVSNEHFFFITVVYSIFFLHLIIDHPIILKMIGSYWILISCYEIIIGAYDLLLCFINDEPLSAVGSFENTGVYAVFITISLPFLIFLLNSYGNHSFRDKKKLILLSIGIIFEIIILVSSKSRTALLALVVMILVYLFVKHIEICLLLFKRWYFKVIIVLTTLVTFISIYELYEIKKLSAIGRLLGLKITFNHIYDNFFWGTGLGHFTNNYPDWQSRYFSVYNNYNDNYYLASGEMYIIFNEPLQLFKEIGLIGLIFFGFMIYDFIKSRTIEKYSTLSFILQISLIGLLICSITSYPLHIPLIVFLFMTAILLKIKITTEYTFFDIGLYLPKMTKYTGFILLLLVFYQSYNNLKLYRGSQIWSAIEKNNKNDKSIDIIPYLMLYPQLNHLQNDGKFLTQIGISYLNIYHKPDSAIKYLEKADQKLKNVIIKSSLAKAYFELKDYDNVIRQLSWISNFTPNKFRPKIFLLKTLALKEDYKEAILLSKTIMNMKVKIPSEEVDSIKALSRSIQEKSLLKLKP